ncbi:hypothetical protein RIB2604_03301120 [Aspergillus luchuensis]|uniref:Uncharacterized protein n=1 Tax=Aspergillus kawachii TaxID=1069201 RepID=A0A146FWQ2_ASPKA|nr:hypothetical protein RIB2604_03301120 [Aspergillus luchuensis]
MPPKTREELTSVRRLATTERSGVTQGPGAASTSTLGGLYPSRAVTDCHSVEIVGAVISAAAAAGLANSGSSMNGGEECGSHSKGDQAWTVLVLVTSARTILMKHLLDMDGQECEASKESLD